MPNIPGKSSGFSVSGVAGVTGVVALAIIAALASATMVRAHDPERTVVAIAVPAAPDAAVWDHERRTFANRLQRGYGLDDGAALEFAGWILEASVRQELSPELLASVVMAESNFRKTARSVTGAVGPAQVRPDLWADFCGADLYDPEQNLYCGAQILRHYRDACAGDTPTSPEECALRAYNVGFGNRNSVYFLAAASRYLNKIDRYREPLKS